ncbi:hypothetical protein ACOJQI_06525 [Bacillus salacetis]|uniref:hypothetical protein n=1 Tax=Bacillus salacetis TaxID=2315464 RepID=UPI003B9F2F46
MGYIAPVTHYQYMQYAEREADKEYDPFTFRPVNRIRPISNKDHQQDKGIDSERQQGKSGQRRRYRKTDTVSPEYLADITGKGKYINEYV